MVTTDRPKVGTRGNVREPICPPRGQYELTFTEILGYGLSKQGFDGKDPEMQFTLEFALEYPYPDDPQYDDLNGLGIRYYCTPIFKPNPREPENSGKLWTLLTAMQGGTPYVLPAEYDEDGWGAVTEFLGKRILATIIPNPKTGWAMIKRGSVEPLPEVPRRGVKIVGVKAPKKAADEDAGDE